MIIIIFLFLTCLTIACSYFVGLNHSILIALLSVVQYLPSQLVTFFEIIHFPFRHHFWNHSIILYLIFQYLVCLYFHNYCFLVYYFIYDGAINRYFDYFTVKHHFKGNQIIHQVSHRFLYSNKVLALIIVPFLLS